MMTDGMPRQVRMAPMARRIVASIGTIPFVVGVFFIVAVACDEFGFPEEITIPATFTVSAAVAVGLWLLVWRSVVVWSPDVGLWTIAVGMVSLAVPIILLWLLLWAYGSRLHDVIEALVFGGPIIGWGVWMAVTVGRWPIRSAASASGQQMPRCLKCGYLLIGLSSTRCPECGDAPTPDERWGAASIEG